MIRNLTNSPSGRKFLAAAVENGDRIEVDFPSKPWDAYFHKPGQRSLQVHEDRHGFYVVIRHGHRAHLETVRRGYPSGRVFAYASTLRNS